MEHKIDKASFLNIVKKAN